MADKIKVEIAASYDDKDAKKALADAEKIDKLKPEFEVDADVSRVLNAFDQVETEAKAVAETAEVLGRALGPELAAKADPTAIVNDLRQMGLTMDQIKGNADALGGKLKELADADIGGKLGGSLGTTRGKLDEMNASASSSKSVLANMVGNATQDLGALGGVAGSAGVAIGQMGEYMADARAQGESFGSIVNNFSAIVGPVAALSIGVGLVTKAWTDYKQKQKEVQEAIKTTAAGLEDTLGIVDDLSETFDEAGSAWEGFADVLLSNEDDLNKVTGLLADLNLTVQDLPDLIKAIQTSNPETIGKLLRELGASDEAADAVAELVREGTKLSKLNSNADLIPWVEKFDQKSQDAINSVAGLADEINGLQPNEAAGVVLDKIATSAPEARDAIAALRAEMIGASEVEILTAYTAAMNSSTTATEAAKAQQEAYVGWLKQQGAANREAADAARAEADERERNVNAANQHRDAIARVNTERDRIDARAELRRERDAVDDVTEAYERMHDEISDRKSLLQLQGQFDTLREKAEAAWTASTEGAEDAEQKQRDYQIAQIDTIQNALDYISTVESIPKKAVTDIEALIDQGKYNEALAALEILSRPRSVSLQASLDEQQLNRQLAAWYAAHGINPRFAPRARGGVTGPGETTLVGEDGPELIQLPVGSRVIPAPVTSAMMQRGGGDTMTVNINMPKGSRGVDVVKQISGQARRSGRRYGVPVVHYARL